MSQIQIKTKDLLLAAFGRGVIQAYELIDEKKQSSAANSSVTVIAGEGTSRKFNFEPGDELGESTGLLGLPIFQQIIFRDGEESLYLGDSLCDIQMTRTIIRTQVSGRSGTIKEFISNGDYEINIKGFLVSNNPYKAPEAQIRAFNDWFTLRKKSIGIEGRMFELFGIHNVVVDSWSFPQLPTYINLRPYELKCYSDDELRLGQEKDK